MYIFKKILLASCSLPFSELNVVGLTIELVD